MMNDEFKPNFASPPGDSIKRIMKNQNISLSELASKLKIDIDKLNKLISGEKEIDTEIAIKLHSSIGGSIEFWIAKELQYREDSLRLSLENADFEDTSKYGEPITNPIDFANQTFKVIPSHKTQKITSIDKSRVLNK